jgi:hypothetical protein
LLPFGEKAVAHYVQMRAELERAGTPCDPHDTQISGHARSEGLIVVTNNLREFARMPGVRVENWIVVCEIAGLIQFFIAFNRSPIWSAGRRAQGAQRR